MPIQIIGNTETPFNATTNKPAQGPQGMAIINYASKRPLLHSPLGKGYNTGTAAFNEGGSQMVEIDVAAATSQTGEQSDIVINWNCMKGFADSAANGISWTVVVLDTASGEPVDCFAPIADPSAVDTHQYSFDWTKGQSDAFPAIAPNLSTPGKYSVGISEFWAAAFTAGVEVPSSGLFYWPDLLNTAGGSITIGFVPVSTTQDGALRNDINEYSVIVQVV